MPVGRVAGKGADDLAGAAELEALVERGDDRRHRPGGERQIAVALVEHRVAEAEHLVADDGRHGAGGGEVQVAGQDGDDQRRAGGNAVVIALPADGRGVEREHRREAAAAERVGHLPRRDGVQAADRQRHGQRLQPAAPRRRRGFIAAEQVRQRRRPVALQLAHRARRQRIPRLSNGRRRRQNALRRRRHVAAAGRGFGPRRRVQPQHSLDRLHARHRVLRQRPAERERARQAVHAVVAVQVNRRAAHARDRPGVFQILPARADQNHVRVDLLAVVQHRQHLHVEPLDGRPLEHAQAVARHAHAHVRGAQMDRRVEERGRPRRGAGRGKRRRRGGRHRREGRGGEQRGEGVEKALLHRRHPVRAESIPAAGPQRGAGAATA